MHTPTSTNPNHSFAQMYILDPSAELDVRYKKFSILHKVLIEDIQDMLYLYNHFVKQLRTALKLNPKSVFDDTIAIKYFIITSQNRQTLCITDRISNCGFDSKFINFNKYASNYCIY